MVNKSVNISNRRSGERMKPKEEANRLGLVYTGYELDMYWFNDLQTESTLVVHELEELEDRVNKSREECKKRIK